MRSMFNQCAYGRDFHIFQSLNIFYLNIKTKHSKLNFTEIKQRKVHVCNNFYNEKQLTLLFIAFYNKKLVQFVQQTDQNNIFQRIIFMFRFLLSHPEDQEQNPYQEQLFLPNLNHLVILIQKSSFLLTKVKTPTRNRRFSFILYLITQIKAEPINPHKNVHFATFVRVNPQSERVEVIIDILKQFQNQKINFISKLQESNDSKSYIEISQNPIHIDNECNYFLLNAYWSFQHFSSPNLNASKSRSNSYSFHGNTHKSKQKDQSILGRQFFFNFIYLISSVLYANSEIVGQFIKNIKFSNKSFFQRTNVIKIIKQQKYKKSVGGVVSTAAQTKFNKQMRQSDIFQEQIQNDLSKTDRTFFNSSKSPKQLQSSEKHQIRNKSSPLKSSLTKLFSRMSNIQINQNRKNQHILQQVGYINQSQLSNQHVSLACIQNVYNRYIKQNYVLSYEQFNQFNCSIVMEGSINQIFLNLENSVEQEFDNVDQKSIEEIREMLQGFYDIALNQFYSSSYHMKNHNTQIQKRYLNTLLNKISELQKVIFMYINKSKKQLLNRKITLINDQNYFDKTYSENQTKFQLLLGEKILNDSSLGYGIYRQSLNQKMGLIFSQLIQQKDAKGTTNKTRKGKLMDKNQFSTNIQRRMEILQSQKRNIEQSLHYEQKMQQNLVQYLKGLERRPQQREIQVIGEFSEQIE